MILEALADSGNAVTYTWYKDGVAIQLGGSKTIRGQGNLQILYAKDEDAGEYKVVARSGGQTIEAVANVNIFSELCFFFFRIQFHKVVTSFLDLTNLFIISSLAIH